MEWWIEVIIVFPILLLVFQTAYGNHKHAVWPLVSIRPDSRNDHHKRWILHLCSINGLCKCFQSFSTIVYQFLSTYIQIF